jgi:hypothetical protein
VKEVKTPEVSRGDTGARRGDVKITRAQNTAFPDPILAVWGTLKRAFWAPGPRKDGVWKRGVFG